MALSAWRVELALQAIHGPAAGCASNLLVCRYPRVRGGLSLIPAISYAVFSLKNNLHGLGFRVTPACAVCRSAPCSDCLFTLTPAPHSCCLSPPSPVQEAQQVRR